MIVWNAPIVKKGMTTFFWYYIITCITPLISFSSLSTPEKIIHSVPSKDTTFTSLNEAENYYYKYTGNFGFSVRKNTTTKKGDSITRRTLVCSKQGISSTVLPSCSSHVQRKMRNPRSGCEARITFALIGDSWVVCTCFNNTHNHQLIGLTKTSPCWTYLITTHSNIEDHVGLQHSDQLSKKLTLETISDSNSHASSLRNRYWRSIYVPLDWKLTNGKLITKII